MYYWLSILIIMYEPHPTSLTISKLFINNIENIFEKIKVMLKWEKHTRRVNWVFQKLFQHNKFKHNIIKNKEIELENSNSDFIVVRHFFTYVHSPQSSNRVRVSLTWNFNQASNLLTLGFRLNGLLHNLFKIQTSWRL